MELTYTQVNGYNIPDLALPPQPEGELNRWGRATAELPAGAQEGTARAHDDAVPVMAAPAGIQETAAARLDLLTTQMAKAQGVTEELKAHSQMEWLGRVNSIRASVEETVMWELVYA